MCGTSYAQGTFLSQFIPLVCLIQGIFRKYVSPRLDLILNQLIKVKCKLVIGFPVDASPAKLPPSGDTFNFCGFLLICATDKVSVSLLLIMHYLR